MKWFGAGLLLLLCCLVAGPLYLFAGEAAWEEEERAGKESYSIGYEVGLGMRADGLKVSLDNFVRGLQDALDSREPRLSTGEMRTLIVDLTKRAREARMRKIQEQAAENARESEEFLKQNREKEGVRTTASGLQYRMLKEGDGMRPTPDDFVRIDYRGSFVDGKEFDSSFAKGQAARVKVGAVIKGWTEALPMMRVGSKWQLFVPPHLAYGRGGLGERIPPNKVLLFEVDLLSIEEADKAEQASGREPRPAIDRKG